MRRLYPHGENELFRSLFLERLPMQIRNSIGSLKLLMPNAQALSLDQIAEYADQLMDGSEEETVNAVRPTANKESMEDMIERVCRKLMGEAERGRSMSRNRNNRGTQHRRSPSNSEFTQQAADDRHEKQPCFYHVKYGNGRHENKRCYPGCPLHQQWLALQKN